MASSTVRGLPGKLLTEMYSQKHHFLRLLLSWSAFCKQLIGLETWILVTSNIVYSVNSSKIEKGKAVLPLAAHILQLEQEGEAGAEIPSQDLFNVKLLIEHYLLNISFTTKRYVNFFPQMCY